MRPAKRTPAGSACGMVAGPITVSSASGRAAWSAGHARSSSRPPLRSNSRPTNKKRGRRQTRDRAARLAHLHAGGRDAGVEALAPVQAVATEAGDLLDASQPARVAIDRADQRALVAKRAEEPEADARERADGERGAGGDPDHARRRHERLAAALDRRCAASGGRWSSGPK